MKIVTVYRSNYTGNMAYKCNGKIYPFGDVGLCLKTAKHISEGNERGYPYVSNNNNSRYTYTGERITF